MKKRMLTLLLVLALLVGLFPAGVLAEEGLPDPPSQPEPPSVSVDQSALMDTIAQSFTETPDGWVALDLALYSTLPDKTAQLSPTARQSALDSCWPSFRET